MSWNQCPALIQYIVRDRGMALRLRSKPQVIQLLTADEEAIKNLEQMQSLGASKKFFAVLK